MDPLFDKDELERAGFGATALGLLLNDNPLGLVDVGARWGVSPVFGPLAEYCDVLAFEPDVNEAKKVRAAEAKNFWRSITIKECALASRRCNLRLNILRRPNNSSIYPVIPHYFERYKLEGFEFDRSVDVLADTLDNVVFDEGQAPRWGEIVKIDAQGAELEIFKGAERTLESRTQCIVCEASFFSVYEGVPLFAEIESFLRARGFRLYGLLDVQHRSTKQLSKKIYRGRERLMQADAIFFRDPFDVPKHRTEWRKEERSFSVLIAAAMLTGFFDYAIELAQGSGWSSEEKGMLIFAIKELAHANVAAAVESLEEVSQQTVVHPDNALVQIGRFVDRNRDFHTYHDAKKT